MVGEIAKRPTARDCKSLGLRPSQVRILLSPPLSGCSSMVEQLPSKQQVAGSSPVVRFLALVAQSAEHTLGKGEVAGSSPVQGF